jgi:CheY-like chemotaxis protein
MEEPTMRAQEATASGRRVLIVDDSRDTARLMQVLLRAEGYETRTAYDGPEAIAAAQEHRPDVVLLDLTLPAMSGVEVAEELRRTRGVSDGILIAISGHGGENLPDPSPFDDHLMKPVDPDALVKLLAKATGRGRKAAAAGPALDPAAVPP